MSAEQLLLAVRVGEWILLVTALLGMLLATYVLADYIGDLIDLGGRDGEYRMTAAIGIRTSLMVLLVFILLLAAAISAFVVPPPASGHELRALVSVGIFEAIALTLSLLKTLNLRDRLRLRIRLRRSSAVAKVG